MRRVLIALAGVCLIAGMLRAQAASQVAATLTSGAGSCGAGNAGGAGCLVLPMLGFSTVTVQLAGTWAGRVALEGSVNGVEPFVPVSLTPWGPMPGPPQHLLATNGIWSGSFPGFVYFRASLDTPNGGAYESGAVTVTMRAVTASLPTPLTPGPVVTGPGLPLPLCNPVARVLCQPKGF